MSSHTDPKGMNELFNKYSQFSTNELLAGIWIQLIELDSRVEYVESLMEEVLEKMKDGVTITGEVRVSNKQDLDGRPEPLDVKVK